MYSTPALSHASISEALIGREALLISVSARQNFWKPPPVPEIPTVTRSGLAAWNSSATASLMGNTVLEPSRVTSPAPPACGAPGALPPPHAAARAIVAANDAIREDDTFMSAAYASAISPQFLTC